jgi:hypothetical protein
MVSRKEKEIRTNEFLVSFAYSFQVGVGYSLPYQM